MTERFSDKEPTAEPKLDRELVVGRLQELGVEIEPEDLEGLDDEEALGVAITHATLCGLDIDDVLPQIAPVEKRFKNELGEES